VDFHLSIVTNRPGLAICIKTADWTGTALAVSAKVIHLMRNQKKQFLLTPEGVRE
jgi:hypothetical protein